MTTTTTLSKADWLASKPAWAKAALIATYEVDKTDIMTDYFATSTEKRVFLAWSKHTKDLFSEMRKAAALLPETAHLGPGKDIYKVHVVTAEDVISGGRGHWKGTPSPWHGELVDHHGEIFTTLADAEAFIAAKGAPEPISFDGAVKTFEWKISKSSIEHREKYSMGAGYYLKGSGRYSSGWTVEKTAWFDGLGDPIEVAVPVKPVTDPAPTTVDPPVLAGVVVALNADKGGVEIRFPGIPSVEVRDALKAHGWRWSGFSKLWYRKDTPDARAFAATLVADAAFLPVSA